MAPGHLDDPPPDARGPGEGRPADGDAAAGARPRHAGHGLRPGRCRSAATRSSSEGCRWRARTAARPMSSSAPEPRGASQAGAHGGRHRELRRGAVRERRHRLRRGPGRRRHQGRGVRLRPVRRHLDPGPGDPQPRPDARRRVRARRSRSRETPPSSARRASPPAAPVSTSAPAARGSRSRVLTHGVDVDGGVLDNFGERGRAGRMDTVIVGARHERRGRLRGRVRLRPLGQRVELAAGALRGRRRPGGRLRPRRRRGGGPGGRRLAPAQADRRRLPLRPLGRHVDPGAGGHPRRDRPDLRPVPW